MTEGDFPKRIGIPLDVQQIEAKQEDRRSSSDSSKS